MAYVLWGYSVLLSCWLQMVHRTDRALDQIREIKIWEHTLLWHNNLMEYQCLLVQLSIYNAFHGSYLQEDIGKV